MLRLLVVLLLLGCAGQLMAQQKYWVYFTDKQGSTFDPYSYFDQKAIDRRKQYHIPLDHISDYPVSETYLHQIKPLADSLGFASRWLNAVSVYSSLENIKEIEGLPFVSKVKQSDFIQVEVCNYPFDELGKGQSDLLDAQIKRMKGNEFQENGYTGKGMRIAILDAGFPSVNRHEAFEHIRDRGGIIATKDFIDRMAHVYHRSSHGTVVLSCIAGKLEDKNIGLAPDAEFLLAITSKALSRSEVDEDRWLEAVEWADKYGADIISSSLAYTFQRYFKEDMNGVTTEISKAGNIAAKKGILVISAAGNDGDDQWKLIAAPADADSVLAVGAINPWTGIHTGFSSYGPTTDKRLKPNITAHGHVIAADEYSFSETQGTSFATPLVAGFAACAWQKDSSLSNMELFQMLEQSGELYPYFDYAHGYGVPQASFFFDDSLVPIANEPFKLFFEANDSINDTLFICVEGECLRRTKVVVPYYYDKEAGGDRHLTDYSFSSSSSSVWKEQPDYLFYHRTESINDNSLLEYFVVTAEERCPVKIPLEDVRSGQVIRAAYLGRTIEWKKK